MSFSQLHLAALVAIFALGSTTSKAIGPLPFSSCGERLAYSPHEPASGNDDAICGVARRYFSVSRHACQKILKHATYSEPFLRYLTIAQWLKSPEARALNEETARRLNAEEQAIADEMASDLNELGSAERFLQLLRGEASPTAEEVQSVQIEDAGLSLEEAIARHEESLRTIDNDYQTHVAETVSAARHFENAAVALRPPNYHSDYAGILMSHYVASGIDCVTPQSFYAYGRLLRDLSSTKALKARLHAGFFARFGTSYPEQLAAQKFATQMQKSFSQLGFYISVEKVGRTFRWDYKVHIHNSEFEKEFLRKFWTAQEFYDELEKWILKALPPGTSAENTKKFRRSVLNIVETLFDEFLPARPSPATRESIESHQIAVLTQKVKELVKAYTDAQNRPSTTAQERLPAPAEPSIHPAPSNRMERIQAYRTERERARLQKLESELSSPHQASAPAISPAVSSTPQPSSPQPPTEAQFENLVATRTISSQRAENILEFAAALPEAERLSLQIALGQLLDTTVRRLSAVTTAIVKPVVRAPGLYELRLRTNTPIRLYFGIDPSQGPMMVALHIKKSKEEQNTVIDSAFPAWKKYLDS